VSCLPQGLSRGALLLAVLAMFVTAVYAQVPQKKNTKLSSELAAIAQVAPQTSGVVLSGESAAAIAAAQIGALPKPAADAAGIGRLRFVGGSVEVYVHADPSAANLEALKQAGATVQLWDAKQKLVQALIPVTRLNAIAALSFVSAVRPPVYGVVHTGSVTTQGDSLLKADEVRSQLHVDGSSVRVGVLSDGMAGVFATGCTACGPVSGTPSPIATADLPNATGTRNASGILTSASGESSRNLSAPTATWNSGRTAPVWAQKARRSWKSCTISPRARNCTSPILAPA
jgi:hypothetical protein